MKKSLIYLLYLLPFFAGAQESLSYTFHMDTLGSKPRLLVEARFRGTDSGKTTLRLPDTWASQKELYRAVVSLEAADPAVRIAPGAAPHLRTVHHNPGQELHLRYALEQDFNVPLHYPLNYRAQVTKQYIHLTGYSLWVMPAWEKETPVQVTLDWTAMPAQWTIANSFHANSRRYSGSTRMGDFENSFYVAGDFRLHQRTIGGKPVYMAIRGHNWKFGDAELVEAAERILTMERKFWNDFTEPYYFLSLIPFVSQGNYNGSALHQSFMMAMGEEFSIDASLQYLLAHEYFHRWIGVGVIMKGDEQENAWFGEGFTEYYTYKLLHRSGILDREAYVSGINRVVSDYFLSPVRNEVIGVLGTKFWTAREYQQIPYKKGFTYAMVLDHMITKATKGKRSLDDVVFELNRLAAAQGSIITEDQFLNSVKAISGQDIRTLHRQCIREGATIPVKGHADETLAMEWKELGAFDAGFNIDASQAARVITGVREGSAAWQAGLRDGQKLKGWSIHYDDIYKPAVITIQEGAALKELKYLPVKTGKIPVPQFTAT